MKNTLKHSISSLKPLATPLIGFALLLLITPRILSTLTPCLKDSALTYTYQECHATRILDEYLIITLVGQTVILILFYLKKAPSLKILLTLGVLLTLLTVAGYYLLVPFSLSKVGEAQIDLESSFIAPSASPSATQK